MADGSTLQILLLVFIGWFLQLSSGYSPLYHSKSSANFLFSDEMQAISDDIPERGDATSKTNNRKQEINANEFTHDAQPKKLATNIESLIPLEEKAVEYLSPSKGENQFVKSEVQNRDPYTSNSLGKPIHDNADKGVPGKARTSEIKVVNDFLLSNEPAREEGDSGMEIIRKTAKKLLENKNYDGNDNKNQTRTNGDSDDEFLFNHIAETTTENSDKEPETETESIHEDETDSNLDNESDSETENLDDNEGTFGNRNIYESKPTKKQTTAKTKSQSIISMIKFPRDYYASGYISLPYDNIVEPFETWYSGTKNLSRIDYYRGMDKTYQRSDLGKYGFFVKITPAHWSKSGPLNVNVMSCWYREGQKWEHVQPQAIVPFQLDKFEVEGEQFVNGEMAYKLKRVVKILEKTNTYRFFVSKARPSQPIRYEVFGFNHLLRSHYDYYVVDYIVFRSWDYNFDLFKIPEGFKCSKQLAKLDSKIEANPMSEFLHNEDVHDAEAKLAEMYNDYKKKHGKAKKNELENQKSMDIFRHNLRYIRWHNRGERRFDLAPNPLTDMNDEELMSHRGWKLEDEAVKREIEALPQLRVDIIKKPLPKQLDWRQFGAVTKVKSQSFCSSCWSFSAVGAVEGAYKIKFGKLVDLSAQQVIDCSWGYENNGCRGGWSWRAFKWIRDHGIATSKSYGRYLGQEGYCHCDKIEKCTVASNVSFSTVKKGNKELLKRAIAQYGPASISVHCSPKTFKFYNGGIYDDKKCTQKTNHAVLVVGWGVEKGHEYWIIKNSWGSFWGQKGFMKLSTKNDLCGVLKNEPILVTFGKWNEQSSYAYNSMEKIDYNKEIEGERIPFQPIGGTKYTLIDELEAKIAQHPTVRQTLNQSGDGTNDDFEFSGDDDMK